MEVSLQVIVFFTQFLSICPYSSLEEVINTIVSINGMVYLLINQGETYDILHSEPCCSLTIVIDIVGGQEEYERKDYSLILEM